MLPNHSAFPANEEEHFLEGTRVPATLENISSFYFKSEFRKNSHKFLEHIVRNLLSTVAARSFIGQDLSCFFSEISIDGDEYSAFYLFKEILDGLLEKS